MLKFGCRRGPTAIGAYFRCTCRRAADFNSVCAAFPQRGEERTDPCLMKTAGSCKTAEIPLIGGTADRNCLSGFRICRTDRVRRPRLFGRRHRNTFPALRMDPLTAIGAYCGDLYFSPRGGLENRPRGERRPIGRQFLFEGRGKRYRQQSRHPNAGAIVHDSRRLMKKRYLDGRKAQTAMKGFATAPRGALD